jgi:hypothetical protein
MHEVRQHVGFLDLVEPAHGRTRRLVDAGDGAPFVDDEIAGVRVNQGSQQTQSKQS